MDFVYFDYNATTPLAPEVASAMRPCLEEPFGNPSSLHWAGQRARARIALARQQIADFLSCKPPEIVLTSGGTEANNFALKGVFYSGHGRSSPHFIISAVEHPAVANTCGFLERQGAQVTRAPVDRWGLVDPEAVRRAIRPDTVLVSVMHANNEVGTIQPIKEIADIARSQGVLMHSDAAQTTGKFPFTVDDLGVDLLTIAGHKMYAPQGVGALYVRDGVRLETFMHGAGHESGRRAGTENVLEIVGLGAACGLAGLRQDGAETTRLRDHFWQRLQERFGDRVVLNGHPRLRLPNTLNVSFVGQHGHEILAKIPEIAASTGSACHAGSYELSPVLRAMGVPETVGLGAIRFSLGRSSTQEEIDWAVEKLSDVLR